MAEHSLSKTGPRYVHGEGSNGQTTPEYRAFHAAKVRCTSPKYRDYRHYGGRGIEFRFTSFTEFLQAVGRRPSSKHSLDRIDVHGHYEAGNVRWATATEQSLNRTSNHHIEHDGRNQCVSEWAAETGLSDRTIHTRLTRGWCDSCAVTVFQGRGQCPHQTQRPNRSSERRKQTLRQHGGK